MRRFSVPLLLRRTVATLVAALLLCSPAFAGGKGSVYSNDLLKLIFNGTGIANVADNAATSPLTNLYVALHSADPTTTAGSGTVNTQNASEIAYTSYARVAVARTSGGWTVSGTSVVPAAAINFPPGTGGSGTATFWSVGVASSGATKILYVGAISPSIVCGSGVTPSLTTASTITEASLRPTNPWQRNGNVIALATPDRDAILAGDRRRLAA